MRLARDRERVPDVRSEVAMIHTHLTRGPVTITLRHDHGDASAGHVHAGLLPGQPQIPVDPGVGGPRRRITADRQSIGRAWTKAASRLDRLGR